MALNHKHIYPAKRKKNPKVSDINDKTTSLPAAFLKT